MCFLSFIFIQTQFLVGGVCLKDFIETQKQEHVQQLEAEKHAREKQKKETLLQETRSSDFEFFSWLVKESGI